MATGYQLEEPGDRGLPTAVDAERLILGQIFNYPERYYEIAETLRPDDIFDDRHRRIYGAVLEMDAEGASFDIAGIISVLSARKEIEAAGGTAYLLDLTSGLDATMRAPNLRRHVERIKETKRLREIIRTCESTMLRAYEPDAVSEQCCVSLDDALLTLRGDAAGKRVVSAADCADEFYDHLIESSNSKNELIGLSTGVSTIDSLTTGIRKKQLWLLGGRTGEGKTCLAMQAIGANASKGIPVFLVTPEMSREEVIERLCIQTSGVPAWKFLKPSQMTNSEKLCVRDQKGRIKKWPLFIDESSSVSAQEIAARARMTVKHEGVQLIVVDYVQLIEAKGVDERQRVSNVSRYLRALAKEVAPVLAVSQMPRPKDLNKWPTKYDLKESGSLENDAHTVLMIFREVDEKTNLPSGNDYLIVPKQRHGPTGFERVTFLDQRLRYEPRP